jgi:hypothetical protein
MKAEASSAWAGIFIKKSKCIMGDRYNTGNMHYG